jgi:hypothetical protein
MRWVETSNERDVPVSSQLARTNYSYFIILLVVAHHTALAWVPYAPPSK